MADAEVSGEEVLDAVTAFYLESGDFNGMPYRELSAVFQEEPLKARLRSLVEGNKLRVLSPQDDLNSHIIRFGVPERSIQLERLEEPDLHHTCLYPTPDHLGAAVDPKSYVGVPYKLELAYGESQLAFRFFELSVLGFYRDDPRYTYHNGDFAGMISIKDEYFQSEEVEERDKVLLKSFGFAFDEHRNRAVTTFVYDLARLSSEHQQIWKARELGPGWKVHPEFYRTQVLGEFPERISVFDAFLEEQRLINQMAEAMGRSGLFRETYEYHERPTEFGFLLRPTLREYNGFILLLDKLLSDNLQQDFFQDEVDAEDELERDDGRVEVRRKGTITMLAQWLDSRFRADEQDVVDEAIQGLRQIRRARQRPAHAIDDNVFDQKYLKEQQEVMEVAYRSVRTIRMILENHPRAKAVRVPEKLRAGEITLW